MGRSWESKRNARDSKNKHGKDDCGRESDGNSVGRLVPPPSYEYHFGSAVQKSIERRGVSAAELRR